MTRRNTRSGGLDRRDFVKMTAGAAAAAGLSLPPAACGGGSSTHKKVIADPEDPTTATDSLVFVVRPKEGGNGKAMEGLSEFQHENEVLFKPGSRFRLVRRETVPESEGWKRTVVFIEEL